MSEVEPPRRTLSRVQTRVVYTGGRGPEWRRTVVCPRHGRLENVDECLSCHAFEGFVAGDAGRMTYMACSVPADELAPPPEVTMRDDTTVADLMTREVLCVSQDLPLDRLAALFEERGIGGVPVVDDAGRPVGFVSKTDLVKEHGQSAVSLKHAEPLRVRTEGSYVQELPPSHLDLLARTPVEEIMTRDLVTVPSTARVGEAAAQMVRADVDRLPVVAENGELVGVVTARDIVRWVAERSGSLPAATPGGPDA